MVNLISTIIAFLIIFFLVWLFNITVNFVNEEWDKQHEHGE